MSNKTVRRFCWTLHNYSDTDLETATKFINEECKYGIFGKEQCPTTGRAHLQGFCNLRKPKRFSSIKKYLGDRIHIEKAMGSDEENQKYCSKAGAFTEAGHPETQGRRNDLSAMVDTIKGGETSIKILAEHWPGLYIRYHRGIEKFIATIHPVEPRFHKTVVHYYWGPPGSGKSRRSLEEARELCGESIYYKPRGLWWDGYKQHKAVIIDDFYGWIQYDELLKICDRYPYKVQVKGGFEEFTSTHIWITSNAGLPELYKFNGYDDAAIRRRIEKLEYIE